MPAKAPNVGLSQAQRLCQMPQSERLVFIAEGLPIIFGSAQGFWQAATTLSKHVREAVVLTSHAKEEAAKVLILMDMIRCPGRLQASRIGDMCKWFYSHLARMIYAEAVSWKPMHVAQLREYVDRSRKSHDLDGAVGEYVVPNWMNFNRERVLYSDIAAYEGEGARWNDPTDHIHEFSFPDPPPMVLKLAEAMSLLGMFTRRGLEVTAETWAKTDFKDQESFPEASALTQRLIERLVGKGLPSDRAEQKHAQLLLSEWPLPMYHLDFGLIPVPLEDLQDEQDRLMWQEVGGNYC